MGNESIPGTISNLNKKAYEHIETWRTRPLSGEYPYVYVDGVYLKRSWGGEIQNVSVLVAIGVSQDGCREILGAAEGMKEDRESWRSFFVWLKERGFTGVHLIIGDKNLACWKPFRKSFRMPDISAVPFIFTEIYFLYTPEQDENGSSYAQGDPCAGKQGSCP